MNRNTGLRRVCFALQVMRTLPSSCCRMEQDSPPTCSWTIQPSANTCSDSGFRRSPPWTENRSEHEYVCGMDQVITAAPFCVCRLLVFAGVICSWPGWSWTGSWTCLLVSSTWTCPLTVWWLCPRCCPGVSSICTL